MRKHVVGDAHLIAICVGAERDERRVLRFPTEPPDAALAGFDIDDQRRAAAHAVAVAIVGIFETPHRVIRNGLDESGAKKRNRDSPGKHVRVRRQYRLTSMARNREHVKEGVAGPVQRFELAARVPASGAQLGHRSGSADRRDVVADCAARAVKRRTQPFFGGFNLEEVVEPEAELLEFNGVMPARECPARSVFAQWIRRQPARQSPRPKRDQNPGVS